MAIPEIRRLAQKIRSANPRSLTDQQQVLQWVRDLRQVLERGGELDSLPGLDAAALLVRCQLDPKAVAPEEVADGVAAVVERIDYLFNGPQLGARPDSELKLASSEPRAPLPVQASAPLSKPPAIAQPASHAIPLEKDSSGMVLGEILVQFGIVTSAQVEEAIEEQAATGRRLGQTLVDLGVASEEDVLNALRFQASLQGAKAAAAAEDRRAAVQELDQSLLGEVLVRMGSITQQQLVEGLTRQRARGGRIGDVLVGLGIASRSQVEEAVGLQQRLKSIPGV